MEFDRKAHCRGIGKLGGRPAKKAYCSKCGVECASVRESLGHCRVVRKSKGESKKADVYVEDFDFGA